MLRACIVGVLALLSASAQADVFVIAPPYYEGTDGQAVSEEIARLVKADLEGQHQVIGPKQAALLVEEQHRVSCPEGACAERYREAAGAVAAVVIRVGRAAPGEGAVTSFQLGIQPSPGVEYTKGALLSDGRLSDIVVKALREAFRDYRQGPGPWLEITGAPEGATVYVDDRSAGTLPWTDTLPLGAHRVRVEARGFEPMTKVVTLSSPTERKQLQFRLEPPRAVVTAGRTGEARANESVERSPGRVWTDPWFYAGVVALGAGGGLAGYGAWSKLHAGECGMHDRVSGACDQFREFGLRSKAMLGTGIGLAVGGLSMLSYSLVRVNREKKTVQVGVNAGVHNLAITIGGTL